MSRGQNEYLEYLSHLLLYVCVCVWKKENHVAFLIIHSTMFIAYIDIRLRRDNDACWHGEIHARKKKNFSLLVYNENNDELFLSLFLSSFRKIIVRALQNGYVVADRRCFEYSFLCEFIRAYCPSFTVGKKKTEYNAPKIH